MNFDLGPVLVALITLAGAGLGSIATIAATLSPTARRIKRLEELAAVRQELGDTKAGRAAEFAAEQLALKLAQNARLSSDHNYSGFLTASIVTLLCVGVGVITWLTWPSKGDPSTTEMIIGGLVAAIASGGLSFLQSWMRGAILDTVDTELKKREG